MNITEKILVVVALVAVVSAVFVSADPLGAESVNVESSSRYNTSSVPPDFVYAQAGNVSQLSINATGITTSWQGYYGNVTGSLILADSQGNNFYNWNISVPSGEVYASRNDTVDWASINCTNSTTMGLEETYLGQTGSDPDSVTNTYAVTSHPSFLVGSRNMTSCPSTHAYNSTGEQGTGFWQVLLKDSSNYIVYSTIIDDVVQNGFNNRPWHFQLLVGENGKAGNEGTTPYYFYVELQ